MNSSTQFLRRLTAALVGSCAAFLAAPLFGQTTATTDPVGFITLNVAGTGGTVASELSFPALGLTPTVVYQGSSEAVGTNSITDNDATWVDNQFNGAAGAFYVELTSGPGAGTTYDISSTTGATKTITTVQNLAAGVTSPVSFKIRAHWTIGSVFGATNQGGLGGGTVTTADQILLWNGSGYNVYYYQTSGIGGVGWRKTGAVGTDASGTVIYPEDIPIIKRLQSAAVNVVLMGAVKTGQTSVPVVDGNNFVGNVYAAPMTLGDCGIYTGNNTTGLAGGSVTGADQILLWNGTGYDTYYYQTTGIGGVGWRKTGAVGTDASGTQIAVGQGMIIIRKLVGSPFNWIIPQHPTTI